MYGEQGTKTRIMKNLDKDPDFLDLLAAWHENKNVSPSRRAELLQRLEKDERLRIELAREIEMAPLGTNSKSSMKVTNYGMKPHFG